MEFDFIITIVIILLAARLFSEIAAYFKIPAVFGEILAGIILGPSVLNWFQPGHGLEILSDIALVLLLFEIGFGTHIRELMDKWRQATLAAVAGMVFPFCFGFFLSYYLFDLSLLVSLFIGSTLTATSIGITLRVLKDLQRSTSHEAHIVLGAAVIDDILGIVVLALIYQFAIAGVVDFHAASSEFGLVIIYIVVAPIVAWLIARGLQKAEHLSKIPGIIPIVLIILLLSYLHIADRMHVPELLAGFAIGLAFSPHCYVPTHYHNQDFFTRVENQMQPILHVFIPFFFVYVGISLNLREVVWNSSFFWIFSALILIAAIVGKFASGLVLFKETWYSRIAVGLAMIPRGEVGLIFAGIGKDKGVFNDEIYATIIIIITITTLAAPLLLKQFYKNAKP